MTPAVLKRPLAAVAVVLAACSSDPGEQAGLQPSARDYALYEAMLRAEGDLRTDIEPVDAPFTNDDLLRNFHRIALHHEADIEVDGSERNSAPNRLGRWSDDIRYRLIGSGVTPATQLEVRTFARRIEDLTGLGFRPAEDDVNFLILITSPEERSRVSQLLGEVTPVLSRSFDRWRSSESLICVATNLYRDAEEARIVFGMIMMGTELSPLMRTSCIQEEVVQALGLGNDHTDVRPSVFNDDEEFALLTRHDEYLLRILYDPRLRIGMTAEEALPVVQRIISELRPEGGV